MAAAGTAKRYAYTVVVERMCEQIRTGALLPGDRLPPERQLARELAVSRTSVRQALQALAERGVVESRQGDGTYVAAELSASFPGDAILDALNRERGVLGDILEFRRLLEPQIAALAARRIDAAGVQQVPGRRAHGLVGGYCPDHFFSCKPYNCFDHRRTKSY